MTIFQAAFLTTLLAPAAAAQTSTWIPDKAHTSVEFTVLHLGISKVHGHFGNVVGQVTFDEKDLPRSKVSVTIPLDSVDTGVAMRDSDLKSPNFFDSAQFPTATFRSTSISRRNGALTITGDLTLHGVTKPAVLAAEGPSGPVEGGDKKPHLGFSASTTIHRSDFGIGPKYPNSIVGDEIKLTIDLDMAKQ